MPVAICPYVCSLSVVSWKSIVCILTVVHSPSWYTIHHRSAPHHAQWILNEVETVVPPNDFKDFLNKSVRSIQVPWRFGGSSRPTVMSTNRARPNDIWHSRDHIWRQIEYITAYIWPKINVQIDASDCPACRAKYISNTASTGKKLEEMWHLIQFSIMSLVR